MPVGPNFWCKCLWVHMCQFVLAFVMEAGGEKKKYFENISLKMPSVFFYRALVLIPSYCWLTEGYTDSAAEVDVAVLAG